MKRDIRLLNLIANIKIFDVRVIDIMGQFSFSFGKKYIILAI